MKRFWPCCRTSSVIGKGKLVTALGLSCGSSTMPAKATNAWPLPDATTPAPYGARLAVAIPSWRDLLGVMGHFHHIARRQPGQKIARRLPVELRVRRFDAQEEPVLAGAVEARDVEHGMMRPRQ